MTCRWRRLEATVAALLVAMLVLAGCGGVVGSLVSTENGIRNADYSNVGVSLTNGNSDLSISATASGAPTEGDVHEIAGIVWHQFHYLFGEVTITLSGSGAHETQTFTFDQLQSRFGRRDPAYNETTLKSGLERFGFEIIIGVVVVGIAVAVLVILLVRRRRRRRRAVQAQWYGYTPYGYGPVAPGPVGPPAGGYGPPGAGYGPPGGYAAPGGYPPPPGPSAGQGGAPAPSDEYGYHPPPAPGEPQAPPPVPAPDGWGQPPAGAPAPPPSGWSDPSWEDEGGQGP